MITRRVTCARDASVTDAAARRHAPGKLLRIACVCLMVIGSPGLAQVGHRLSYAEVERYLRLGTLQSRIQTLVDQRGIEFELTPPLEKALRDLKATDALISALKRASVPPPPPSKPSPQPPANAASTAPKSDTKPEPSVLPASSRPIPTPTTEADYWTRAMSNGSSQAYEEYLKYLLRENRVGAHKAEAQARLASLWTPRAAPAPTIVDVPEAGWVKGYRGEGCERESAGSMQMSDDRDTVAYIAKTKCATGKNEYALFAETRRGDPKILLQLKAIEYTNIVEYSNLRGFTLTNDGRRVIAYSNVSPNRRIIRVADAKEDILGASLPSFWADASLSDDGRVLIAVNGRTVKVLDRQTGAQDSFPATDDGKPPNKAVGIEAFSSDGRFIVVSTAATNVTTAPKIAPSSTALYMYDRQARKLAPVTVDPLGNPPGKDCSKGTSGWVFSDVSDDGQWVVFTCEDPTLSLVNTPPARTRQHLYARHMPTGRTWLVDSAPLTAFGGQYTFQRVKLIKSDLLVVERLQGSDENPDRVVYWVTVPGGAKAVRKLGARQREPVGFSNAGCAMFDNTTQWCPKP